MLSRRAFSLAILTVGLAASLSEGSSPGGPAYGYQGYSNTYNQGGWQGQVGRVEESVEEKVTALPPGWTEYFDHASNQPYYHNSIDGTTTWERPVAEADPQAEEEVAISNEGNQTGLEAVSDAQPDTDSNEISQTQGEGGTGQEAHSSEQVLTEHPVEIEQSQPLLQSTSSTPVEVSSETAVAENPEQSESVTPEQQASPASTIPPQEEPKPMPNSELGPPGAWGLPDQQQQEQQQQAPSQGAQPWGVNKPMDPKPEMPPSFGGQGLASTNANPPTIERQSPPSVGAPPNQWQQQQQKPVQGPPGAGPHSQVSPKPFTGGVPPGSGQQQVQRPAQPVQGEPQQHGAPNGYQGNQPPQQTAPPQQHGPPNGYQGNQPPQQTAPPQQQQPSFKQYQQQPPQQQQQSPNQYQQQPPQQQRPPYNGQQYYPGQGYNPSYPPGPNRPPPQMQGSPYNQYGQYGNYRPQPQPQNQLVSQETREAVRGALGSAWQGILGFGNRTKEVVETAKTSVVESAKGAGQSISSTSTNLWGQAKNTFGSFFEPGEDTPNPYSLTGAPVHGQGYNYAPGPGQYPRPQGPPQGQAQRYPYSPPQQQGYPPQRPNGQAGAPPQYQGRPGQMPPGPQGQVRQRPFQQTPPGQGMQQGQGPPQRPSGQGQSGPTQGNFPPGYRPPQPRSDAPFPGIGQQQIQPQRPQQSQWGAPPGNQAWQQGQPQNQGRPMQPPQQRPQNAPQPAKEETSAWDHPGLNPDF